MTPLALENLLRHWNQVQALETQLEQRDDIGNLYSVEFFLKREDRIDDIGSGHKRRKLQYLRDVVLRQGANVLITAGSLPSGQCVAVATAACTWGMRARVAYLGDIQNRPHDVAGHYLHASVLASRIDWFERTPWSEVDTILKWIAEDERSAGAEPFIVAPGILEWPAPLASVELGLQIFQQLERCLRPPRRTHIVALAGTGGTCAGLWAAAKLLQAEWIVHGVCIGGHAVAKRAQLTEIANRYGEYFGVELGDVADLQLHEFDWSGAYAMPSRFELEAIRRILREHQLPLDPNYMIKVFLGFEALMESGQIERADRVILIHSGGSVDFISGTPHARKWFSNQLRWRP